MRRSIDYVGCSLKLRLGEDGHIASTPSALRRVACAVLRHGRPAKLLAFRCEANQIRIVVAGDEAQALELDRKIKIQLRRLLRADTRFGQTWLDVLTDVWKLSRAFKSVFSRSGWVERVDPFQEGSNLPDLLGLRTIGRYTISTVKTKLPDIQRSFLKDRIGVVDLGADELPLAWHTLDQCTMAVVGATDLKRRTAELAAAKRAAVQVAAETLRTEAIGALLRLRPRSVRTLRKEAARVDPPLKRAVTLQLPLRAALAPQPGARCIKCGASPGPGAAT
jgi:hypothetical protein